MAGDDIVPLLGNNRELGQVFPHWDQLLLFASGQISASALHKPSEVRMRARATTGFELPPRYSFTDAHTVVGGITKSFASYWESECRAMKQKLVPSIYLCMCVFQTLACCCHCKMSRGELGALDETSWLGKQVIISNYIQGASNCIVTASHYSVCCINECEPIMEEIEAAVEGPLADPDFMLSLVGNMTSLTTLEDEVDVQLDESLVSQLHSIAKAHGGRVPIHGRLFAQWLHYVFPRDCSFPHKSGAAQSLSPTQFGDGYLASDDEMEAHAKDTKAEIPLATMKKEELQWMSQWSEDEELIASYSGLLAGPSSVFQGGASKTVIALGFGLFMLAYSCGKKDRQRSAPFRHTAEAAATAGDPVAKFCMQHAVDYSAENALRALPVELQCKILNEGPLRASNPSAVLMSRIRKAQTLLAEMRRLGKVPV
ncbi:leuA [Symbiodinium necroappetens]|uniref:LeuA protein n=1 Tax=Symbiodinium necroappetens TaxID=1628268 RepID=A0A813CMQ3_9DINO|nr:leuA [Symbiodinium necroappetens]